MYDTAFRHMAASNVLVPWSKVNEQLYSDILKEETLYYCISCHTYGHCTLACPARSKSNQHQPFRSSTASLPSSLPDPSHLSSSPSNQSPLPQQLQPVAIYRNFTRHSCRQPNCEFQHICNKLDCGGNHPGSQCLKGQ